MKSTVTLLALLAAVGGAWAQATPVGVWKSIDDDGDKKEKAIIRISDNAGVLTGKIEKILDASKAAALCEKCSDDRKDKPIQGMTMLRNVKPSADDKDVWDGGEILDPNNGKTYKVRLKPLDGGKRLEVRGFIGPFFRNQIWLRAE